MTSYARHVRGVLTSAEAEELERVDALAGELRSHIETTAEAIAEVHVFGAQSKVVQDHMAKILRERLGFGEEVVLTPQDGFVTRARPDFFFTTGPGRGIIAEVERGGTTNNNHDLKDMWKAHLAPDAHHLFLIVPMINWKENGSPRERPFTRVASRIGAFFGDPRREVNVLSAHIFGY